VAEVTRAFAPFLLPMIDALGALDEEKLLRVRHLAKQHEARFERKQG